MKTELILTGIQDADEKAEAPEKPMKKDNILWMLFDRDWAEHLITDKNLIN